MRIAVVVQLSFGTGENGVNDAWQPFFFLLNTVFSRKKKKKPPLAVSQRGCQKQKWFPTN